MGKYMGLAPQIITEELYTKATQRLKTLSQDNRAAIRLRAIVSAKEQGVNVVAKVFGVSTNTIRSWVKSFAQEDLPGLEYQPGRGRKSKLSDQHIQLIKTWVNENPNITIAAIVQRLNQECTVESSKSAVHRILHKLDLSYITPRPVHHKQDKSSHPAFFKKSRTITAK
jgi:transposase